MKREKKGACLLPLCERKSLLLASPTTQESCCGLSEEEPFLVASITQESCGGLAYQKGEGY